MDEENSTRIGYLFGWGECGNAVQALAKACARLVARRRQMEPGSHVDYLEGLDHVDINKNADPRSLRRGQMESKDQVNNMEHPAIPRQCSRLN